MNDNGSFNESRSNLAPLVGFALGALVGGTVALLLAPASGEQTRRRLGAAARQIGSEAGHTIENARHKLEDARDRVTSAATGLGSDVKSAIDAGREAFRHEGQPSDPGSGANRP